MNYENEIKKHKSKIAKLELEIQKINNATISNPYMKTNSTEYTTYNTTGNVSSNHKRTMTNNIINSNKIVKITQSKSLNYQILTLKEENKMLRRELEKKQTIINNFNQIIQQAITKLSELIRVDEKILKENIFLKQHISNIDKLNSNNTSYLQHSPTNSDLQNCEVINQNINELKQKLEELRTNINANTHKEDNQNQTQYNKRNASTERGHLPPRLNLSDLNQTHQKTPIHSLPLSSRGYRHQNSSIPIESYTFKATRTRNPNNNLQQSKSMYQQQANQNHSHFYRDNLDKETYTFCDKKKNIYGGCSS